MIVKIALRSFLFYIAQILCNSRTQKQLQLSLGGEMYILINSALKISTLFLVIPFGYTVIRQTSLG